MKLIYEVNTINKHQMFNMMKDYVPSDLIRFLTHCGTNNCRWLFTPREGPDAEVLGVIS